MPRIRPICVLAAGEVKVGELSTSSGTRPDPLDRRGAPQRLRQAEVEHLDRRRLAQLDVGRLQVAVDDTAARARPRAPRRSARRSAAPRRAASGAARESMRREVLALDELHHERLDAAVASSSAVDLRDVRVIERGKELRLALEAASRSGSVAKAPGRTLMATSRCSFVSCARYTSPIPPAPSEPTTSYAASRVPGRRFMELPGPPCRGSPPCGRRERPGLPSKPLQSAWVRHW